MIYDYAGGRRMSAPERLLFAAAAENERVAGVMEAFGTRNIGPAQMMLKAMGPALGVGVRRSLRHRTRRGGPPARAAALPAAGREGASAGAR
jgi:hypothetical protein